MFLLSFKCVCSLSLPQSPVRGFVVFDSAIFLTLLKCIVILIVSVQGCLCNKAIVFVLHYALFVLVTSQPQCSVGIPCISRPVKCV